MKTFLCSLLLLLAGAAHADELSDANRLLMAKSYTQALPIYAKLANAGNPAAQFRLGEMYWYGDGTAVDMEKANFWIAKSAAAGNRDAQETLAVLKKREARAGEITWWTSTYGGADLTSGKFDCKRPAIPAVSKSNAEIKAVSDAVAAWEVCYNGFVANLNDAMPPGKRIPADVLDMMSPREAEQARNHLDRVYSKVGGEVQAGAENLMAAREAWHGATQAWVKEQNDQTAARNALTAATLERWKRERAVLGEQSQALPAANSHR